MCLLQSVILGLILNFSRALLKLMEILTTVNSETSKRIKEIHDEEYDEDDMFFQIDFELKG